MNEIIEQVIYCDPYGCDKRKNKSCLKCQFFRKKQINKCGILKRYFYECKVKRQPLPFSGNERPKWCPGYLERLRPIVEEVN